MSDPFSLAGRRVLVTGATRGIGLACARLCASLGASVVLTGRKAESADAAAAGLRAEGFDATGEACHQGDPDAVERLFATLDHRGHAIDAVVVNAATNPVMAPLAEVGLDAWQKILDVNLTGALRTAQAAARRMTPRKTGVIVFVASVAGIEPMDGLGAYGVSKAGVLGLMRALAKELGPHGVRVNAVAPGLIDTRFASALFADADGYARLMSRTALGRHGTPDDVAGVVAFLLGDASRYVTGQVLTVDGGGRV